MSAPCPGKLAQCQERDPAKSETLHRRGRFSAGGSAKQGRDRANQAVLPLRGKILNVERARFDRMLSSQEIGTLITALGTGIGHDEFDIEKLRYHKIIIMTDADVDGAHIRTLLLTFFFRQMPELIEGGYLYIAQPPLYKVTRGKSEVYLKDQRSLDDYLMESGITDASLTLANGEVLAGPDLKRVVEEARRVKALIANLPPSLPRFVMEQAAIAGALDPEVLADEAQAQTLADRIGERLDAVAPETERGWTGSPNAEGGLRFMRTVRGVTETRTLDSAMLNSSEARKLHEIGESLAEIYTEPATFARKERTTTVRSPSDLIDAVMIEGEKGVALQRYKGLGEMNADQLWETTLDPEARTLLQVRVEHVDEADQIFSNLMGDMVEPRREFIMDNALNVENLDI